MSPTRDPSYGDPTPLRRLACRGLIFVFVLAIVLLEFPGAREVTQRPHSGIQTKNLIIQNVLEDSPNGAKDIQAGDQITAVDGVSVRNHNHYHSMVVANTTFSPQVYTLLRGDVAHDVNVEYEPLPDHLAYGRFVLLIVALAFIMVGTWVYLRRPDTLGFLFALNCACLAFLLTDRPAVSNPVLQLSGELIHDAIVLFFPAVFLHFFLVFPGRPSGAAQRTGFFRSPRFYVVPAALFATTTYVIVTRFGGAPVSPFLVTAVLAASTIYFAAFMIASLVVFVRAYIASQNASRQKLRIIIAGTMVGIVPFLLITLLRSVNPGQNATVEAGAALSLGFIPVTFGYAILKHGAIELNDVVRKSLVYACLSGAIIAVYYVVVRVAGDALAVHLRVPTAVITPVAILVLAVVFAPARDRVQNVVDRLFYRGEYTYKQEVYEFNRQLGRRLNRDEILSYFIERVDGLLRSTFVCVYAGNGNKEMRLVRSHGAVPALPAAMSNECFLARYLSRYRTPLMIEYLDPSWERPHLDLESRQFLTVTGMAAAVPIVAPDRFMGVAFLGEKRSGLIYKRADAELLQTFSEQLALVLQNAELVASSLEKERLKNEVMLARDIQLSLLPDSPPLHAGIEVLGHMDSSFEVGGDYFDYFLIDEHRIGVAIGDVSGKGIPAAMLMSSLQAVFKNLALKAKLPPAELNHELNTFLCENAKTGQFATFFYGIVDMEKGTFTFSNAGHCPALVVKQRFVDRLGEGGMILGVQPDSAYVDGTVGLEPSDLIVLYTDGVTEQKDADGEEYGEDRLISMLQAKRNLPVADLQNALYSDVLAFGNGDQQDDITSVIASYKGT